MRALLQNYPAFHLCAINVCADWPEDAYKATATHILQHGGCSRILGDKVTASVRDVCVHLHTKAKDVANESASPEQVRGADLEVEMSVRFFCFYGRPKYWKQNIIKAANQV